MADVVRALEPLLKFASEIRFVDPFLDASLPEFFDPLAALVKATQTRANPSSVRLEFHTGVIRKRVTGQSNRPEDIAREIVDDCKRAFAPVLKRGTSLRVFTWSEGVARAENHNRYVLSNVGGVSVPTGLDRARPAQIHTDDFTVLSREQHQRRWESIEGSRRLKCVLGPEVVAGTALRRQKRVLPTVGFFFSPTVTRGGRTTSVEFVTDKGKGGRACHPRRPRARVGRARQGSPIEVSARHLDDLFWMWHQRE